MHPLSTVSARVSCGHAVSLFAFVLGLGGGELGKTLFYFSSKLGECGGKRTILSVIEKFGHGELTVLAS